MLFMLDNYDSFTFNLVQYFQELGQRVHVARNDEITLDEIAALKPERICLSPGPGRPADADLMPDAIARFAGKIPMLGVCLGMQGICEYFGCSVVHASTLVHGKVSEITHDGTGLFKGLPSPMSVTRYHSLCIDTSTLNAEIQANAHTQDGVIMSIQHRTLPIHGVQFHPEAILTQHGHAMLNNWLGL
ncbi:aminodeoxychorismate/anthranilate synthase component II [Planctomycetota bacterium]|nr:aminodeoxychorismate/anthranilate synthase component II [Planctomycetota bacterium]